MERIYLTTKATVKIKRVIHSFMSQMFIHANSLLDIMLVPRIQERN